MKKPSFRVKIPTNPSELLSLAAGVYAKHVADGATSPLKELEDNNWTDNGPGIANAITLDNNAKQMEKDLEELYRQRDILIAPIALTVKASRDLLIGKYPTNYKKLGDWTFIVDDSPKAKKKKVTP